jgi:hypothetical protein
VKITSSPWGRPQSQRVLAPGIVQVSCEGHGGILVSPERFVQMPACFQLDAGADGCWYEEECAAYMVYLAFPQDFSDQAIWYAVNFILAGNYYPDARAFVEGKTGAVLRERHKRFMDTNGSLYSPGTMSSSGQGWTVHYRRISDNREAIASGLSNDEAFSPSPVDLSIFGDRVKYAPA